VLPAAGLVVSFYLDLPAGPASVALLAMSVPIAATIGQTATRRNGVRRT
jgi:hypothetical protein